MRSIPTIVAVISASLAFVSCSRDSRDDEPSRYGRSGTYSEIPQYTPPPPPDMTPEQPVEMFTPPPTPPPTTVVPQNNPYASPVAGKPGFVISPHAPYSGYVDVRGFSPGMEVKCPYTQKVFLVP